MKYLTFFSLQLFRTKAICLLARGPSGAFSGMLTFILTLTLILFCTCDTFILKS